MKEFSTGRRVVLIVGGASGCIVLGLGFARVLWLNDVDSHHFTKKSGIGIPALVQQVREELIASDEQRTKANMPALFVAKSVDLEISFVVKQEADVGSKVSLEVIDVDSKHSISAEQAQKLTIHLDIQQPEHLTIPPTPSEEHK